MKLLFDLYHWMYRNPMLFKINCALVELGIEKQLAYWFNSKKEERKGVDISAYDFFTNNKRQISNNLDLLYDEKSKEIYEALIDYRITRKPLDKSVYSLKNQYFIDKLITVKEGEIFVDCGAFVGDTIHHLYSFASRDKVNKVIAIEPEKNNALLLRKYYKNDRKIIVIEAGVSNCNKKMSMEGESTYAKISESKNTGDMINVVSIDELPECYGATFIKMDIEGAEMDALIGAQKTIIRDKPKLAICIYHSNEDMLRIIPFIHELNPKYKLFVRHHSRGASETVLYAIP